MIQKLYQDKGVCMPEDNDSPWYPTSWGMLLPRYPSRQAGWVASGIASGLYLALCQGHKTPEDKNGWGFDGPLIGPLSTVCSTRMSSTLCLFFSDVDDAKRYFSGEDKKIRLLDIVQDTLEFDGCYFGGWTMFAHPKAV